MANEMHVLSSIRGWLLSCYGKSPLCVATLMGILAFVLPPKVFARDITPNEAASLIKDTNTKDTNTQVMCCGCENPEGIPGRPYSLRHQP